MRSGRPSILTTHTGSLPRPADVGELLREKGAGRPIDEAAFQRLLPGVVRGIVERQLAVGLDVVNDGEAGKVSYATYVADRFDGFASGGVDRPPADLQEFPDFARRRAAEMKDGPSRSLACVGPVTVRDPQAIHDDIARLKAAVSAAPHQPRGVFMTAASPGVIARFFENRYYASQEEYLSVLAGAMRAEYKAIIDAGLILQIDAPDLGSARNTVYAGRPLADFRAGAARAVEALNSALEGLPPERMRLHVCWGNYEGPHHLDVELKDTVDLILAARPAWISVESANPRHEHEWEVWSTVTVPEGKGLIPGVIDSTTNFIEHPRLVAQRLLRFASVLGPERVMAGVDCGFASFVGSSAVDPEIAWAKLGSLVDGARIASEELTA
jgi:5-methyltetrahydropteroyltriglutamate--homocysteine methyltransferase